MQERLENARKPSRLYGGAQLAEWDVLIVDGNWTTGITVAKVCKLLRYETPVDKIIAVTLDRVSRQTP